MNWVGIDMLSLRQPGSRISTVRQQLWSEEGGWDEELIGRLFGTEAVEAMRSRCLTVTDVVDELVWTESAYGAFSTRSA